jgi:hypothetical protein
MGAGKGRARRAQSAYTYPTINVREYVCDNADCPSHGYVQVIDARVEEPICKDCDYVLTDKLVEYPTTDDLSM